MDDQNNNPQDTQTTDVDAANSQLMESQAAEAAQNTEEAADANPFAALKESDETEIAASPEAPRNDVGIEETEIAEPEIKEPEIVEAIGTEEKTQAEDAESASDPVVTVESASEVETEE